jgi:putative membrane protein
MSAPIDAQKIYSITGPEPVLLTLYLLRSLASLVFFPLVFIPLWIRYATLRYQFDGESVRKSYGLVFRHEDLVQYARIQDLHLSRSLLERWLGLATIQIQTASGSAAAEMTIEGLTNFEEVRDFLYARMRGARFGEEEIPDVPTAEPVDEVVELLTAIRDELRFLRRERP